MQPLDHLTEITQYTSLLVRSGHVFHAYLFRGFRGVGKEEIARSFASSILCSNPQNGVSCGVCSSCESLLRSQHPDFLELCVEDTNFVSLDAVRDFQKRLQLTPMQGQKRIGFIPDMSTLRIDAWNALLKTLEEPSKSTILIMVYHEGQYLLPTVASRCHHIYCSHVASKKGTISEVFSQNRPYFSHHDEYLDSSLEDSWKVLDDILCADSPADAFVQAHSFVSDWKKKNSSEILFYVDAWIVFMRELLRFRSQIPSSLSDQYMAFQRSFSKSVFMKRLQLLFELRMALIQKKSVHTHIFIENFSIL